MFRYPRKPATSRRSFLGTLAAGAGMAGMATLVFPFPLPAAGESSVADPDDPDTWFNGIHGKHRIVFDVTGPHGIFPFAWPKVFLMTNKETGTPEKDCSVVVILRHEAIPYAMESSLWEKYKFGESLQITDPLTKAPSVRNIFWQPAPGDFSAPGIGNIAIGINELQDSGVMFCVCHMALIANSAVLAQRLHLDPEKVKKDFLSGILPGIQVVPSGVWAVNRAQEHGCSYCFAG